MLLNLWLKRAGYPQLSLWQNQFRGLGQFRAKYIQKQRNEDKPGRRQLKNGSGRLWSPSLRRLANRTTASNYLFRSFVWRTVREAAGGHAPT